MRALGRPPAGAERAGPCFRPRRPTRAERAAAANFDESVSAVLYTPIYLNWVQFSTEASSVKHTTLWASRRGLFLHC